MQRAAALVKLVLNGLIRGKDDVSVEIRGDVSVSGWAVVFGVA